MSSESSALTSSTDLETAVKVLTLIAGQAPSAELLNLARSVLANSNATTVAQAVTAMQAEPGLQEFAQALDSVNAKPYTLLN